jgi:O-antigen/teichoic acid export membrane protein
VLIKALPFLLLPILATLLSVNEFGTLSMLFVFISFFLMLIPMGVGSKVILLIHDREKFTLDFKSVLIPVAISTMVLLIIVVLLKEHLSLNYELVFIALFLALNLGIGVIVASVFQAKEMATFYGSIMLGLNAFIYIPLVLAVFYFGHHAIKFSLLLSFFLQVIFIVLMLVYTSNKSYLNFSFSGKDSGIYAMFALMQCIHILANAARFIFDRAFLSSIGTSDSFAYYNLAMQIAMISSVVFVSLNRYWFNFCVKSKSNIRIAQYLYAIAILLVTTVVVSIFGRVYISLFFSENYIKALDYLNVLQCGFFCQGAYLIFAPRLYINEKFKMINLGSFLSLLIAFASLPFLYEHYSTLGIAYSMALSWFSLFLFSFISGFKFRK